MTYAERIQERIKETGSNLCVGIDPRFEDIEGDAEAFLAKLIEDTAEYAAAFKPNIAYFEALGSNGVALLERLLERMVGKVPVVLDVKRGDIGATQAYYAKAYFERWGVDAVTLSPYMGFDSVEPFLGYEGKGVYLLGVTSNEGAADIERRELSDGREVFELVADFARSREGDTGLVVGLTNASGDLLGKVPDVPLLVPGLGAQGGDLAALAGQDRAAPILVNVSRGIMFGEGERSFREKAKDYADRIADIL
ncbi:MAG: orotidine-5'-phosphate decarboxylase [Verrucomicrobiota bacterium]